MGRCGRENGWVWIRDPENKQPVKVELNDAALSAICRQQRSSDYFFCHKNGKRFKTGLIGIFNIAAERAGVDLPPRKAWHMLRRTWAILFLQSGGDVKTLRVLGNWRDYSMPMWYAEAAGSAARPATLNRLP